MKNKSLTLFSYYGGKARWAKDIAELLDYNNTDVYIEPFGGACSLLLNKPPHKTEIYSDLSRGMVALIECLTKPETAEQLIESLYDTEYSEECFKKCLAYKNSADINQLEKLKKEMYKSYKTLIKKFKNSTLDIANSFEDIRYEHINELIQIYQYCLSNIKFSDKLIDALIMLQQPYVETLFNMPTFDVNENSQFSQAIDNFELAKATYVVYSQSRDGMGTSFSKGKYKTNEQYYRGIDNLYHVADRLKGVHVTGVVSTFLYMIETAMDGADNIVRKNSTIHSLLNLNNERVMMYLDPPYLNEHLDDLGRVYTGRMSKEDHERLLKTITKSRCKILISNYDNSLYNKWLYNWHKTTIDTTTSVGGKADNKRTECLWWNY